MKVLNNFQWTAIIPIRAGSIGLPDKNTKLLCGKPLYRHAIDLALEGGANQVLITTDISEVIKTKFESRVKVIERPHSLCDANAQMAPVISHAIECALVSGPLVLLQATSPLRNLMHLNAVLELYKRKAFDLIMTIAPATSEVLKWGALDGNRYLPISDPAYCFANRQSLPKLYRPNGAIYAMDSQWFLRNGGFVTENIGVIEMTVEDSIDIDTLLDFQACEAVLNNRKAK
jgi:CMP-N-acetylneuraminic acid synthetase